MPEYEFEIWHSNPNAEQGGGDLLHPHKEVEGVKGPWVVFPNVDCAEAQGQLTLPHAAVPMSALLDIFERALTPGTRNTDQLDGVKVVAAERSVVDRLLDPGKPTLDFAELTVADQDRLRDSAAGQVVRMADGSLVQVPGDHPLTERYEEVSADENPGELDIEEVIERLESEEAPAI